MASDRKIKRRLLAQVVEENVDLIAGRRPRPPRMRDPWIQRFGRWATVVLAPVALLVSSLALSGSVVAHRGEAVPVEVAPEALSTRAPRAPRATMAGFADQPPTPFVPLGFAPVARGPGEPGAAEALDERLLTSGGWVAGEVFPLAVQRIVLDAGHGGRNTGTATPFGMQEKELTLDITRRLAEALADGPYEILLTRDDDATLTLEERAAYANRMRADIFVSIHVNWFEGVRASGIETYYLGPTDDPFLTRLAARENRDSGHSMAELRDLVEGIYAGVRQDRSEQLAKNVHRALFQSLSRVNPKVRDRGVKTAPFIVLVDTEMPAILAEVATASSQAEAAMLEKPLYRQYIADALATGIRAYADSSSGPARDDFPAQPFMMVKGS
jgi:N-acetylmuramoyl-L-alanine amidase